MKIQSIGTVQETSTRAQKPGAQSAAATQTPTTKSTDETSQPKKSLREESLSADMVRKETEALNDTLKSMGRSLRFNVDDKTDTVVVKVVDEDTGKIIREIPPESVLKMRERLSEMNGLLLEEQA
jgi:flagellar protein FlaG